MNVNSVALFWIIFILITIFLIFIFVAIAQFLNDFSGELRYLNNEIARSEGVERKHWKRRRLRLWFSLLPFVRY